MFVITILHAQQVIVSIALVVKCINYPSINLILLLLSLLNLFAVMYGDQLLSCPSMIFDITLFSLMITPNSLGFIFLRISLMCLIFLSTLRFILRIN